MQLWWWKYPWLSLTPGQLYNNLHTTLLCLCFPNLARRSVGRWRWGWRRRCRRIGLRMQSSVLSILFLLQVASLVVPRAKHKKPWMQKYSSCRGHQRRRAVWPSNEKCQQTKWSKSSWGQRRIWQWWCLSWKLTISPGCKSRFRRVICKYKKRWLKVWLKLQKCFTYSNLPGVKSLAAKYTRQDSMVRRAINNRRSVPRGMPAWKNANGSPTKPPPIIVLIKDSAASQTVI